MSDAPSNAPMPPSEGHKGLGFMGVVTYLGCCAITALAAGFTSAIARDIVIAQSGGRRLDWSTEMTWHAGPWLAVVLIGMIATGFCFRKERGRAASVGEALGCALLGFSIYFLNVAATHASKPVKTVEFAAIPALFPIAIILATMCIPMFSRGRE